MDASVSSSDLSVHIHNYSLLAVKSIILEVKKYPIIYNGCTEMPFVNELIDFAWARIAAELLDNNANFDSSQKKYWDRSFRELWKWIRSILRKDMIARCNKPIHYRNPEHSWLVYLKFLEPFIHCAEECELDPNIHIQVQSSEVVVDKNHTVIWLRDASEPADPDHTHISICLRNTEDVSMDFNRKPSGIGVLRELIKKDNAQIINYQRDPAGEPHSRPSQSNEPCSSEPMVMQFHQTTENEGNAGINSIIPLQGGTEPPDENLQYVMCLLPRLHELESKRKAEVKVLMIQALHDVLDRNLASTA